MDRLWIVDGHAAFFRAYHAIRGGMTSPVTGEPTHLVYGFTGTLLNMIRTHQPTKLVVVIKYMIFHHHHQVGGDGGLTTTSFV